MFHLNQEFSILGPKGPSTLLYPVSLLIGGWDWWSIQIANEQYRDHLVGQLTTRVLCILIKECKFSRNENLGGVFCLCRNRKNYKILWMRQLSRNRTLSVFKDFVISPVSWHFKTFAERHRCKARREKFSVTTVSSWRSTLRLVVVAAFTVASSTF